MKISNAFPSKYVKCSDLQGRAVSVTIDRAEMEQLGSEWKPIVYFKGKEKGLVLNKTNANTIADMYGDDTDQWTGKGVTLRPTRVDFKGERVDAIRVEFIQPPPRRASPATQPQPQDERNPPDVPLGAEMNDEVPF